VLASASPYAQTRLLPMDIHFNCTICGKCRHNLKIPLTISEAIQWLQRDPVVEILCDAVPWPVKPDSTNAMVLHKRSNSFAARCGTLPVRIVAVSNEIGPLQNGGANSVRSDMEPRVAVSSSPALLSQGRLRRRLRATTHSQLPARCVASRAK
jgi:hypothetical protein